MYDDGACESYAKRNQKTWSQYGEDRNLVTMVDSFRRPGIPLRSFQVAAREDPKSTVLCEEIFVQLLS